MNQSPVTYHQLEERIITWGKNEPELHAAIVIGSRTRIDHPADEWSDLDLILFVDRPDTLALESNWLDKIGEVWLKVLNHTDRGDPEWIVLFAAGLKADFVLAQVPADGNSRPGIGRLMAASPYRFVFERGVRLLFDKNGPSERAPLNWTERCRPSHPSREAFSTAVDHFLLQASRVARFLRRGDLWRAKQLCDNDLKQRLLSMLAWQAHARYGLDHDTWYDGRFLTEWADPQAVGRLPGTFAVYELESLWAALFATLDLYCRMAKDTAGRLDYPYPGAADERITGWLQSTYAARGVGHS